MIRGNTAIGDGGGIFIDSQGATGTGGSLMIAGTMILGNTAVGDGGGISYTSGYSDPLPLTVTDSTLSGNTAGDGGGI